MVRILNFVCVAPDGAFDPGALSRLGTDPRRQRRTQPGRAARSFDEHSTISVLQTEWERVAGPERIQQLARAISA